MIEQNLWPYLRKDKEHPDRVCTGWGTKTLTGLTESIRRWVVESPSEVPVNPGKIIMPHPDNMVAGEVYYAADEDDTLLAVTILDVTSEFTVARVTADSGKAALVRVKNNVKDWRP